MPKKAKLGAYSVFVEENRAHIERSEGRKLGKKELFAVGDKYYQVLFFLD